MKLFSIVVTTVLVLSCTSPVMEEPKSTVSAFESELVSTFLFDTNADGVKDTAEIYYTVTKVKDGSSRLLESDIRIEYTGHNTLIERRENDMLALGETVTKQVTISKGAHVIQSIWIRSYGSN